MGLQSQRRLKDFMSCSWRAYISRACLLAWSFATNLHTSGAVFGNMRSKIVSLQGVCPATNMARASCANTDMSLLSATRSPPSQKSLYWNQVRNRNIMVDPPNAEKTKHDDHGYPWTFTTGHMHPGKSRMHRGPRESTSIRKLLMYIRCRALMWSVRVWCFL